MYKIAPLVVCLMALVSVYADDHDINDCVSPGTIPTILYDQENSKEGKFLQVQEETIRIPETGFAPKLITCITVNNLGTEANGGYPKITTGGVNYNYVSIEFKSQMGKGFDFKTTVYYDNSTTSLAADN